MFSTIPRTGSRTCSNMLTALRASSMETSEGVVTTIGAGQGSGLNESQLDVAGAGRQVDDQIIKLAPFDVS